MPIHANALPKLPAGYRLLRLETVDSTNAEAARRAAAGETGPLWIWSLRQSAGRGRAGRDWISHSGNLFASLLLTLNCPLSAASQLALVAGIAAFDAVKALIGEHPLAENLILKWPNDVLIRRRKLAGILIENAGPTDTPHCTVIIGTGLNLTHHPEGLIQPATDLAAHGLAIDSGQALEALAASTDHWLAQWDQAANFQLIRRAWLSRAGPLGAPLSVKLPNQALAGTFDGLDASGSLRLRLQDGTERRITAGDVFFPSE